MPKRLFALTLDKSIGGFSPTTRYRDYAISRTLIHWESQSITHLEDSATGKRYRNHEHEGRYVMLFTPASAADDRAFWFLGPATYRSHEGEKPMKQQDHAGSCTIVCQGTCTQRSPAAVA